MTNITISARTRSLNLTKTFAAKAAIFGTDEYKMLQEARRDYPGYKVNVVKSKAGKERRKGGLYCVNPFKLLINDGNYYLLAVNEKHELTTYRVDRMRDVALTGLPREDEEVFAQEDMRTYAQRVFGMHGGDKQTVTLRFIPPLLDTMIERFGTKDAIYGKMDGKYYYVTATVKISDPFYGWVLGFGNRVKVVGNGVAVEGFRAYLDKIRGLYE